MSLFLRTSTLLVMKLKVECNLNLVMKDLESIAEAKYTCKVLRLSANEFFLPQTRPRIYIVGFRTDGRINTEPEVFFRGLEASLDSVKVQPAPLQMYVEPPDSPALADELNKRRDLAQKRNSQQTPTKVNRSKQIKFIGVFCFLKLLEVAITRLLITTLS